ncbi:MAG: asparagine synthase (glutamine-hydrolyzing) [Pseudomonadales bacterium]
MCGIAGIHNLEPANTPPSRAEVERMVSQIRHRGPDGDGFLIEPPIALGHARLSIIDLKTGDQPIHNESEDIWVVFNGEIFNYVELRKGLKQRGHKFYTESDTEVIVHLYEERGIDFVDELNGQYAIALWDARLQRLVLSRDRAGILPLFYTIDDNRLLFGSEVKSILPALSRRPRLNAAALDQLFTFWAPVSPATLFDGVLELSPGTQLIVERGRIQTRRYWDWEFAAPGDYLNGSVDELSNRARDLLIDAVKIRLRADVPVGAYLSGGLDSSALVALIDKYGDSHLRTFSLEFENADLDERVHQQAMVQHIATDHTAVTCRDSNIIDLLPSVVWHAESPMLRTAPVPMGILSGHVREQGYKVVLTGEGADEVFGGYDLFKETKLRKFWSGQPQSKSRPILLKRLYPYLNLSKKQDEVYLQRFFGIGIEHPEQPLFSHLPRALNTSHCKLFFSDSVGEQLRGSAEEVLVGSLPERFSRWESFNRAQYLEARTLMSGYLLSSQGDRMLMKNSVEGRFPYLDHRLIEFANRLDPRLKMKVLNEKYLLKRAVSQLLPSGIVNRYKQPYRAPDIQTLFGAKKHALANDLLSPLAVDRAGYFNGQKVSRLLQKALRGRAVSNRDSMALMGVLTTQMWHELFVNGVSVSSLSRGTGA